MLQHKDVCQDAGLVLALLRVVKVLTRKQGNRLQFGGSGLHQVCAGVSVCACVCGFSFLAVGGGGADATVRQSAVVAGEWAASGVCHTLWVS